MASFESFVLFLVRPCGIREEISKVTRWFDAFPSRCPPLMSPPSSALFLPSQCPWDEWMGWDEEAQPLTVWIKMMSSFTFAHFPWKVANQRGGIVLFYTYAKCHEDNSIR
jgi:hypothetical protein